MLCRENIFFFYFDFNNSILISFAFFGQHMRRLGKTIGTAALHSVWKRDGPDHFISKCCKTHKLGLYYSMFHCLCGEGSSWMNSLCTILRNRLSQSSFESPKRICKEEDFDKSLKWTPEALWVQDFTPFILEFFRGLIWPWVKMF